MSKYLYNGISLLDINTVWTDKTTYPYAIIFGDEYGGEFLHISPVPFIYEDPNVNISSGAGSPRYINDSDGWVEHDSGSGCTGSGVKWTNYDIIDISDNSVYLAASEPVPDNGNFDLKSWLIGFALGLAGKPLPFAKNEPVGEPVAYLYGTPSESGNIGLRVGDTVTYYTGVVAPHIDTVYTDELKVTNPYAYVARSGSGSGYTAYHLCFTKTPQTTLNGIIGVTGETYKLVDGEWAEETGNAGSTPLWTNTNICYSGNSTIPDGTLYMAASDPIPVGEIVDYDGDIPIYEVIT